ncbi:MAG: rhomboid family intramembrane serine protease [Myxococcales bacterium]|nr:rhomboid family intramembrane serine protease [Myxococcales bacterium]MCB9671073.1 rhomboid family intramembrane serine protease [Alphaproteobacteria bacterium]MCB9692329.1 rhomboid family intramembrane serine protease [Alphaproteobacteria bacterium]
MREPRPTTDLTLALFAIAAVNLGVYALWQVGDPAFMRDNFIVSAPALLDGRWWTLISTMFSQIEPTHLLFNLLALWVFGSSVERVTGPVRFALLYLFGGLAGSIGYVLWAVAVGSPVGAVGASGAVMAIASVYGLWFPNRTLMINFIFPMPAWMAVLVFIGLDTFGMLGGGMGANVAYAAHLGGAFFGLAVGLPRFLRARSGRRP